jgi:hypothetical protein
MKNLMSLLIAATIIFATGHVSAQGGEDKSKRASPPASVKQTINGGATSTINYGRPSVKGRTIGKDLEPMDGKVWRAGANEATTFETDKAIMVEGKRLSPGKYAFFTLRNGAKWTLIFNKTWDTWGAFDYEKNKSHDALQVTVTQQKSASFAEKLTYTISKNGKVSLAWGNVLVTFNVSS